MQNAGVVYQATVTTISTPVKTETYIGLTGGPFKVRYTSHLSSFRNVKKRTETALSDHIWNLKDEGTDYNLKWKILDRGRGYNITTKSCRQKN